MLVIVSDIHLTDGSGGPSVPPGAFAIFAERLRELTLSAARRGDGRYRPLEEIDLLLLGDVLDVIRSRRWVDAPVRPWHAPGRRDFQQTVQQITAGILEQNRAALQILRGLAREGALRIPPATAAGRPDYAAAPQSVPVRIHYLVGNADWFFHLPGDEYDRLRAAVAGHLGLANRHDAPFPHDPLESPELLHLLRRHGVQARHGDALDPFACAGDRDGSSLSDALAIELLGRFSLHVERELAGDLPAAALHGLAELDYIRPLLLAPVWLEGLLERTCHRAALRQHVKAVWDRLVDEFLELPFVRQSGAWRASALVDGLQRRLSFSRSPSTGWASSILRWLDRVASHGPDCWYRHAAAEAEFRNRRARYVVYGHTHHAEQVPLDASYTEQGVCDQLYFNAGTWRRVYRQTRLAPRQHEFIPADAMHYLAFFRDGQRGGRPFESWSGTLGMRPAEPRWYRVDDGGADHAGRKPFSAPTVPLRAPHFPLVPGGRRHPSSAGQ